MYRDRSHVDPAYRDALRSVGLDGTEGVLRRVGDLLAAWSRSTGESCPTATPNGTATTAGRTNATNASLRTVLVPMLSNSSHIPAGPNPRRPRSLAETIPAFVPLRAGNVKQ